MAPPTSYTETTFGAYLEDVLANMAVMLGWTQAGNSFDEVINETLLAMGQTDIANVTDIRAIRAIGRLKAWQAVAMALASDYDFSADGASYSRSQAFEHAKAMINEAHLEAAEFDALYSAIVEDVTYTEDPYENHDDYLSSYIDDWEASQ